MKTSLFVLGLCTAATLVAQGPAGRGPRPGMDRGMGPGMGRAMMGPGVNRTVTGAPYSAVEVTETTQALSNGNVISQKSQSSVYRDGMGRVRTETTLQRRGPGGAQATTEAARTVISIHDPVAGVTRELDTQAKVSRETPIPAFRGGSGNAGARPQGVRPGRGAAATSDPNVQTETLAMQTINGVQATGTRVTRTIPAGEIGNAQPIQIIHETWMSPDLKVAVMDKTIDPRFGTTVTQLTNITRAEPDPALFQAPADYSVTKTRAQGRGPRGAGGNMN